jgi:hypothetical protein
MSCWIAPRRAIAHELLHSSRLFGNRGMAREFGTLARIHSTSVATRGTLLEGRAARSEPHPHLGREPLISRTISKIEDGVDPPDRLQRDRRDRERTLATPRIGCDVGQLEELTARMGPTERLDDRTWFAIGDRGVCSHRTGRLARPTAKGCRAMAKPLVRLPVHSHARTEGRFHPRLAAAATPNSFAARGLPIPLSPVNKVTPADPTRNSMAAVARARPRTRRRRRRGSRRCPSRRGAGHPANYLRFDRLPTPLTPHEQRHRSSTSQ